ncbi:hypothetical protein IT575_00630 [bacterium]|nr:hypothetical protein [bacterium]
MQTDTGTEYPSLEALLWKLALIAGLVLALGLCLTASTCNSDPGFGDPLVKQAGVPAGAADYMFVADSRRQLYWPNQAEYVRQIPEDSRVWIKDAEALSRFKGYKPGAP